MRNLLGELRQNRRRQDLNNLVVPGGTTGLCFPAKADWGSELFSAAAAMRLPGAITLADSRDFRLTGRRDVVATNGGHTKATASTCAGTACRWPWSRRHAWDAGSMQPRRKLEQFIAQEQAG